MKKSGRQISGKHRAILIGVLALSLPAVAAEYEMRVTEDASLEVG